MSVICTEMWSEQKHQPGESASRAFQVSGVATPLDAVNAAIFTFGVAINVQYPTDAVLRVKGWPTATRSSFNVYRVEASYARGTFSDWQNPLAMPPRYTWQKMQLTTERAVDKDGNPILNSALYPPSNPPERKITYYTLSVVKNIASFNFAQAQQYVDTFNSDTLTVPLAGQIMPGQCCCRGIMPVGDYNGMEQYLPIRYDFEVIQGYEQDPDGWWDAFKLVFLDQGNSGWAITAGGDEVTGKFMDVKGTEASNVFLDSTGRPTHPERYTVCRLTPDQADDAPDGAIFSANPDGSYRVKYVVMKPMAYRSLNIFG